jgi:acylphosphatase
MSLVRRYRIYGRVQGVGYRAFVWRLAASTGLKGWVRNRADGSVEALLEIPSEATATEVKARLEAGPRLGRVERIESSEESSAGPLTGFDIRSTL